MGEHAPNVCVKALLEELKLGGHLEHLSSPRQFDRTETWYNDFYNWRDNAKLVTKQEEQVKLLNEDKKTQETTIKNLKSQIQIYKNEQKEGCQTLRVDEDNGTLQKRIVYQWSKTNGDVVTLSEEQLQQLKNETTDENVVEDGLYELQGNSGYKVKNIILVAADKTNTHNFKFENAFDMFGEEEGVATVSKLDVPSYVKTVGGLLGLCDTEHKDMVLNSHCRPVSKSDPVQTIIILSTEQHIQEEKEHLQEENGKNGPVRRKGELVHDYETSSGDEGTDSE
jgi:hypothetical protein